MLTLYIHLYLPYCLLHRCTVELVSPFYFCGYRTEHKVVAKEDRMLSEEQASQNSPISLNINCLYVTFGFSGTIELCLREEVDGTAHSCIIICPGPNTRLEPTASITNVSGHLRKPTVSVHQGYFKPDISLCHISYIMLLS